MIKKNNSNGVFNDLFNNRDSAFLNTSSDNVTEDEILDYLASIIAEIYLSGYKSMTEEDCFDPSI